MTDTLQFLVKHAFLKLLYAGEPAAEREIGPADAGGIVVSEDLCNIGYAKSA